MKPGSEVSVPDYIEKMYQRMPGAALISQATGTGDGRILYANRQLLDLFDCESLSQLKKFSGGTFIGLVYPDDVESAKWYIQRHVTESDQNDQAIQMQYRIHTCSNKVRDVVETSRYIRDPEEGVLVYSILTRSEEDDAGEERDRLTGLPNMRAFLNHAEKAAACGRRTADQPVYYIYLNLTHFRRYNMKHGIDDGDSYLKKVSEVLRSCFAKDYTARFSADHFAVLSENNDYASCIKEAHDEIAAIRPEATVELKAGVYQVQNDIACNAACDLAKIACDFLSHNPDEYMKVYDDRLAKEVEQREYITENIDQAIENGWIKVYYQPVVRSISGALCGFEALTRWDDPRYGFMNPGSFIHVLEENHLIHKLDLYVVREVCRKIREEIESGHKAVPVSFNLSRLDFMLCDCYQAIEECVKENNIPRDMIRIEITESAIMQDKDRMSQEIEKFQRSGYQVWMDDFGSGYSSLNMLKDFHFDELKLDMEFLRSFTDSSRKIVASTVQMAKMLNMHTLAEGVETEGQAEFLRSVGCEKMQGYYFGRPEPFEESMRHCLKEKGLETESREWNNYFDKLGMINVQTDIPLILLDVNGEDVLTILYSNPACMRAARDIGYSSEEELLGILQKKDSINGTRIRKFLHSMDWSDGKTHTLYLTDGDHFIRAGFKFVAAVHDHSAYTVSVLDLSREEYRTDREQMDAVLRNILMFYDNVYIIHFNENYMETRFQDSFFREEPGTRYFDIHANLLKYASALIYRDDADRFLAFMDDDTMVNRIKSAASRSLTGHFRVLSSKGRYRWKIFECMLAPSSAEEAAIITFKDSILENDPDAVGIYTSRFEQQKKETAEEENTEKQLEAANHYAQMAAVEAAADHTVTEEWKAKALASCSAGVAEASMHAEESSISATLWQNALYSLPINLFWKDRQEKILGVSRYCEQYTGVRASVLIGHGAWEFVHTIASEAFEAMEKRVLTGKNVQDYPVRVVFHGTLHNILVNEAPLYKDGEIVGLIGFFIDADTDLNYRNGEKARQLQIFDSAAGCMNSRGAAEALFEYCDAWAMERKPFNALVVDVYTWKREVDMYGEGMAVPILQKITDALKAAAGYTGFVGRLTEAKFLILSERKAGMDGESLKEKIRTAIESIHTIGGHDVTLRTRIASVAADSDDVEEMTKSVLETILQI